jgi:hypothetical protein
MPWTSFRAARQSAYRWSAELQFDLVARARLRIGQEQVQATGARLSALDVANNQLSKPEQWGVFGDPLLKPFLAVLRMAPEAEHARALIGHLDSNFTTVGLA